MRISKDDALKGVIMDAFAIIFRNVKRYSILLLLALFLFMAAEVVIGERVFAYKIPLFAFYIDLNTIFYLVISALGLGIVAIPLHNFIINKSQAVLPWRPSRVALYALLEFAISIFVMAGFLLWSEATGMWNAPAIVALFVFSAYFGIVLVLLLPHVAVTPFGDLNPGKMTRLATRHRMSIILCFAVLVVPMSLVRFGAGKLLAPGQRLLPGDDTLIGYYTPVALDVASYAASVMILITLSSVIYLRLNNLETGATAARQSEEDSE